MTRLAIFDCDGTLVDSQHNICTAVEEAFAANALAVPPRNAIRRIVGLSLVEAMRMLLPDSDGALHERIAKDYKDAFFRLRSTGAMAEEPLYDGITDLLSRLSAARWMLGVATGKSDRGLAHILSHHGIAGHFITLQTADRHPSKPHPAMIEAAMREAGATPGTTAMIGDTSSMISVNASHMNIRRISAICVTRSVGSATSASGTRKNSEMPQSVFM